VAFLVSALVRAITPPPSHIAAFQSPAPRIAGTWHLAGAAARLSGLFMHTGVICTCASLHGKYKAVYVILRAI
jgi:hypothetical protein